MFAYLKKAGARAYSNYAVGYNNVDVKGATKHGIPVGNTPGVLTEASACLRTVYITRSRRPHHPRHASRVALCIGTRGVALGKPTLAPRPVCRRAHVKCRCAQTTAELAAALTLAATRRVVEADEFMRAGKYKGWLPTLFVGSLLQVGRRSTETRVP